MKVLTNNVIFGKNLTYIRQSNGFTVQYMAKLLNITEEQLYQLESGQYMDIDGLTVKILLNLLEDETADLFEKSYF